MPGWGRPAPALTSMLSVAAQEFRYRRHRRALFSLLCEQPIATPLCSGRRCRGKPFSMEGRALRKGISSSRFSDPSSSSVFRSTTDPKTCSLFSSCINSGDGCFGDVVTVFSGIALAYPCDADSFGRLRVLYYVTLNSRQASSRYDTEKLSQKGAFRAVSRSH